MNLAWRVCLSGCLMVAAVEVGLRVQSDDLPSMRGGIQPFSPTERPAVVAMQPDVQGCIEADPHGDAPQAWGWMIGEGEPHKLLFAGDSVTLGQGVRPAETFAVQMGLAYAATHGVAVEVVNAGMNAAGYCGVIRAVHHHHAKESFARTVVALFADDLEQRAVVLEGDALRANPALLDGAIASLATHSHAVNWLWHAGLTRSVQRQLDEGGALPPHITIPGRTIPSETINNLKASIEGLAKFNPLWLVIPPAGLSHCVATPDPRSECAWLVDDMDRIAAVLASTGSDWVDLRTIHGADFTLNVEMAWWRREGRLPVHPNRQGHKAIAAASVGPFLNP